MNNPLSRRLPFGAPDSQIRVQVDILPIQNGRSESVTVSCCILR